MNRREFQTTMIINKGTGGMSQSENMRNYARNAAKYVSNAGSKVIVMCGHSHKNVKIKDGKSSHEELCATNL